MADLAAAREAAIAAGAARPLRFIEQNPWESGFARIFDERILPELDELERDRIQRKQSVIRRGLIGSGVIALMVAMGIWIVLATESSDAFDVVFGLTGLAAFGLGAYAWAPARAYRSGYKNRIMPVLAEFIGDFRYDDDGTIPMATLQPSGLIPSHDTYHSEDRFTGSYKGVDVEVAEAKLTETQGSGKNRRTVTKFRGLFVLLSVHKKFKGVTQARQDMGLFNALRGKFSKYERVHLEDPRFEKLYEVFASDQIEARYLLTTAFMDRVLNLAELYGGGRITFAFYDDKLLLMVPVQRNQFEPANVFEPVIRIAALRRTLREFHTVCSIVDELKMNQKIGL